VVPADHKWFTRIVVSQTLVAAIEGLDLAWPKPALAPADLAAARKALAPPARSYRGIRVG
jgi:hypothetical protein